MNRRYFKTYFTPQNNRIPQKHREDLSTFLCGSVAFLCLCGVTLFSSLIFVISPSCAQPSAPSNTVYAGSDTCASCHQAEYDEWRTSKHAGAFSKTFVTYWEQRNKAPECLMCHTTGFNAGKRSFAFKGVSCESCHGVFNPAHPDQAKMSLPTDSSACMGCHAQTYREWRLSGHAKTNIRCFDCHAVHRQGLRQSESEKQCGACHAQRLEDFAHATHHQRGLTCATCHMPHPRTTGIGGTGAPAHSFFVGAETCAACHEEMVHKSHQISSLSQEVERLAQTTDARYADRLEAKIRKLELEVDLKESMAIKNILLALALGLFIGGLLVGFAMRQKNGRPHTRSSNAQR